TSGRHTFGFTPPEGSVPVECDADRITQVLSNMLSNAVKYSDGGEIRVAVWADNDQLCVSVTDRGQGIPPDRLEAVFEPHVRLVRRGDQEAPKGSGLGLFIARGIMQAHGGSIRAESTPGQGSTFTISLPAVSPFAALALKREA